MQKTSAQGKNIRAYNSESLGGIYKKSTTMLETFLQKGYGNLSSLSPRNWESLYQKGSH